MERYLITQSLLSSWAYIFTCWDGYEEDAKAEFVRTLNREESEPTDAMLDGIAFENLVYSLANGSFTPTWKPQQGVNSVSGEVFERFEYPKHYNGAKKVQFFQNRFPDAAQQYDCYHAAERG